MRLLHLSDLHLGKRLKEFSLLEDQDCILHRIRDIAVHRQVDGMIIAGDVYDRQVPPAAAVSLFDRFLTEVTGAGIAVYIIAGNHDSPERLSFGSRLMEGQGVHIAPVFQGKISPVRVEDEYGAVNLYLLPFVKPAHVRNYYPDREIADYTDAVRTVVGDMEIDEGERNILVAHQFAAGGSRCESEEISVGGLDQVDISCMKRFDYVALGHLHGPQRLPGADNIRYSGSPLKYSFSEISHKKSVVLLELAEKGELSISQIPLLPEHDLLMVEGPYEQLVSLDYYKGLDRQSYVHATLTDEEEVAEAFLRLRAVYPRICSLSYRNRRTVSAAEQEETQAEQQTPLACFQTFYRQQNGQEMSSGQEAFVCSLMEEIWEDKDR